MIELFSDMLFDVEYKCFVSEDYQTLYLHTNNVCVGTFTRHTDITHYFKQTYSYLRKHDDFNLEKAEYIWSIKKFMYRNFTNEYVKNHVVYGCLKKVEELYSYLFNNVESIGTYNINSKVEKKWIDKEYRKELERTFRFQKGSYVHFDDVLLFSIEKVLNKMFKVCEEDSIQYNLTTVTKKDLK